MNQKDIEINVAKYLICLLLQHTYNKVLNKEVIKHKTVKRHKDGTITVEFSNLEKARLEFDKLIS